MTTPPLLPVEEVAPVEDERSPVEDDTPPVDEDDSIAPVEELSSTGSTPVDETTVSLPP